MNTTFTNPHGSRHAACPTLPQTGSTSSYSTRSAYLRYLAKLTLADLKIEQLAEAGGTRENLVAQVLNIKTADNRKQEALLVLDVLKEALRAAESRDLRSEASAGIVRASALFEHYSNRVGFRVIASAEQSSQKMREEEGDTSEAQRD
ncbi:hypothetical protein DFJ73DRAFT_762019 [Zopfochytrium polystomum]|nr:hypothetical protein DFJ73DRAFT_762019 [Zopfochytrium polystomum]